MRVVPSLVTFVFLCASVGAQGTRPSTVRVGGEVKVGWGVGPWTPTIAVDPELLNVPIHPDDALGVVSISDSHFNPETGEAFWDLGLAPTLTISRVTGRIGLGFKAFVGHSEAADSYKRQRYPPFDAYVYYTVAAAPSRLHPFAEVECRLTDNLNIMLGVRKDTWRFTLERGWDRFSRLQTWRADEFGTVTVVVPYAGLTVWEDSEIPFGGYFWGGISSASGHLLGESEARRTGFQGGFGATIRFRTK